MCTWPQIASLALCVICIASRGVYVHQATDVMHTVRLVYCKKLYVSFFIDCLWVLKAKYVWTN